MQRTRAQVDASGRVLIPAEMREKCGLAPGTPISLTVEGDRVVVRSVLAAWREAQTCVSSLKPGGKLWSEELIAERRAEAQREYGA